MKTTFLTLTICGFFLFGATNVKGQQKGIDKKLIPLKIGIPISQEKFNNMVKETSTMMEQKNNVNAEDIIKVVRIINTLKMDGLIEKNKANKKFDSLFEAKKYREKFIKKLHATLNIGMSYYSKKHKVFLGGRSDDRSKFYITDLN